MIDRTDIERLNDLPVEKVAGQLGMRVHRHLALCPFHQDTRPSLTFNVNRNRYRCFVCGAGGGSIDLVMHAGGLSFPDACRWLAGACAHVPLQTERTATVEKEESGPDLEYLSRLMARPVLNDAAMRFLFAERRLDAAVIRRLGIGSISCSCPMSGSPTAALFDGPALLIPYRDPDGRLVSVQSRYLGDGDRPRFRFPKGSSCHIFNMDCLKGLDCRAPVIITEGVTDCLAALSAGYASVAVPSATLLKAGDLGLLEGRRLHMFPDRDEPGERLFEGIRSLLPQTVRHELPAGFKDLGQYYASLCGNRRA